MVQSYLYLLVSWTSRLLQSLLIFLVLLLFSRGTLAAEEPKKPLVVTTTGMLKDLAEVLAGSYVEVKGLIGTGVDPHLYKPTRSDIALLSRADLAVYNGLLLEGKMTDAFHRLKAAGRPVLAVGDKLPTALRYAPPGFEHSADPHIWMDPIVWQEVARIMSVSLRSLLPSRKNEIQQNLDQYTKKLDQLHTFAVDSIGSIPPTKRVLVTAHDAFHYLSRRYGVEVVGIQGISTESEAGVRDIERIIELLVTRDIHSVFVETTVPNRNVLALVEGAEARGHTLKIGGNLFSDAMGKEGTYEGTYLGMIDRNISTIATALGGTPAPRPFLP